jgi:CDP-diacylglycerol--glycerol-3-phosphate 3-phosphatidyltransferase
MFNKDIQKWARNMAALAVRPLANLGISPNTFTLIGLLLSFVTAIVIGSGFFLAGGLLVLFTGIFDLFDGATARVRNLATTFGAFFDSTLDRYSEAITLSGLLFYALFHPSMQDSLWFIGNAQIWMIVLIYISIVGSLMVSYTKARAEGLGIECRTGLLARPERVVILAVGLLFGIGVTMWVLVILALFSNVTAIERMVTVFKATQHQEAISTQVEPKKILLDSNVTSPSEKPQ